ncbi:FIST C-terminal domain-containing protein [Candidatus Dependentiae bacterium]|nr:FIST C-terminal domain-containing protein [Candidatus Dependentiae bacterium]
MLKIVIGHSDDVDSRDAIIEILTQCKKDLGKLKPNAGLLFSSIDYEHVVMLKSIRRKFPGLELIGCTTDGEISSILGFKEDSVTLILFYSDSISIKAGLGRDLSKSIKNAAKDAVSTAKKKLRKKKPTLCITVPESLTVSGVKILKGLKHELGNEFPIFGGTAGDQYRMKKTLQFYNDEIYTDSIPVLLFSGPILFSAGISSGWKPIGKKRRVTKVKDNVIFEVDNKPALDYYMHYFGAGSTLFGEYPIAVFNKRTNKNFYIRSPIFFNKENKSITYSADIPKNAFIQFAEGTRDNIISAAKDSVESALKNYPGKNPKAAVIFSCSARKSLLGTRTKEEFNLVKDVIKNDIPVSGFYTYGEIGSCHSCKVTNFHNSTFITLLLGEKD